MAVDLMEILPEYFRPILEFQEIMEAEGEAAEEVERTADRLSDNCFIQTCDEATRAYYERLLQISNIGATLRNGAGFSFCSGIWNPFIHFRS